MILFFLLYPSYNKLNANKNPAVRTTQANEKGKKIFLGMIETLDALKCQSIAMKIEIKKALTN